MSESTTNTATTTDTPEVCKARPGKSIRLNHNRAVPRKGLKLNHNRAVAL